MASIRLRSQPLDQAVAPLLVRAPIIRNEPIGSVNWHLRLESRAIAERARPGQFVMLTVGGEYGGGPLLPRPMAIFACSGPGAWVDIVYRVAGSGTRRMTEWPAGARMTLVGPLGRPFQLRPSTRAILLMGRGIGTCSLTALASDASAAGVNVVAVTSARHPAALVGVAEYTAAGVRTISVVDTDGSSAVDLVRSQVLQAYARSAPDQIFVCGSERLLQLGAELAAGFEASLQVSIEANMACGLGYCHACASGRPGLDVESPLICTQGPVFACDLLAERQH